MRTDTPDGSVAVRWRLDPAHSRAEFRVPTFWGLVKVKGHFDRLDGWLDRARAGAPASTPTGCR